MPVEIRLWRVDQGLAPVTTTGMDDESRLKGLLVDDIGILDLDLMVIDSEVITDHGKRIDILAIDAEGQLYAIELKKDKTPRDAVAQLLDYGSWIRGLTYEQIVAVFEERHKVAFETAFADRFGGSPPETLNESHRLVLVASSLDSSSERILDYLAEFGVPANAVFFRYFIDEDREYLARTWLQEPRETDVRAKRGTSKRSSEPWNGRDFYVSFGEGPNRRWEDARRYGFISGGHGVWYSRTLDQLFEGARVFVNIPAKGYVAVGVVKSKVLPVKDFKVDQGGKEVRLLELPLEAPEMGRDADNPELSEYVVAVDWIKTVPVAEAFWEKGMYANQNTVTKLKNRFTLERLIDRFELDD